MKAEGSKGFFAVSEDLANTVLRSAKRLLNRVPLIGPFARKLYREAMFPGSAEYWESRYSGGGNSGPGSYGNLAAFKADVLNAFVREHDVHSVIELGCGDGYQLSLCEYPRYIGLDVSESAVKRGQELFAKDATKTFLVYDWKTFPNAHYNLKADLALSLDVIYHLREDHVFQRYMEHLFGSAERFVIIYSSDTDTAPLHAEPHVRHRKFTDWVAARLPDWQLSARVPNRYPFTGDEEHGSFSDFFSYRKRGNVR